MLFPKSKTHCILRPFTRVNIYCSLYYSYGTDREDWFNSMELPKLWIFLYSYNLNVDPLMILYEETGCLSRCLG